MPRLRSLVALTALVVLTACGAAADGTADAAGAGGAVAGGAADDGAVEGVRDATGRVVSAGAWSVFDLRVGDCISSDRGGATGVSEVPLVPCAEPHAFEVFAVESYPDDAYPGAGPVGQFADFACLLALTDGLGLTEGDVDFSYLLPTESGWAQGDRAVVCVLFLADGSDLVGSFVAGTAAR